MTAIAALTSDNLKEPDREVVQLARLNSLISAMNNLTGDGTPAAITGSSLSVVGQGNIISAVMSATGSTSSTRGCIANLSGSYDTTAGALTPHALDARANGTKSAGGNNLVNMGLYAVAANGDTNYAIYAFDGGDVALAKSTAKLGFYSTAPIAKQTGVAVTAAAVHAALVALGLIGV